MRLDLEGLMGSWVGGARWGACLVLSAGLEVGGNVDGSVLKFEKIEKIRLITWEEFLLSV